MAFEAFEKLPEEKKDLILSTGIKEFSKKSFKDVSTDSITKICGISKGILFHYFGSKKEFYFYCLDQAMKRLTVKSEKKEDAKDFYDILFSVMNKKIFLCTQYSDEMHLVNMASRDASSEIEERKEGLIRIYMAQVQMESAQILTRAMQTLDLKEDDHIQKTVEGLHMYINAVLNKYLVQYQKTPDAFWENRDMIKAELKIYLDLMLFGICKEN